MNKITKESVLSGEHTIFQFIAKNNDPSFNYNKALEEATEFMEVIIKLQTKSQTNPKRPDPIEAIKEYGDMCLRGFLALLTLFPEETEESMSTKVENHIKSKMENLAEWLDKGTYKNGL